MQPTPPTVWMEELEGRTCFSAALGPGDPDLQAMIVDHEGEVLWVYPDAMGNPTIGVGLNLAAPGARERLKRAGLDYDQIMRAWEARRALWLGSGRKLRELRTDSANRRKWEQFLRDHPPQKALTKEQSRRLLEMVLEESISDAKRQVARFDELGHNPQTAVVDMVYNLGPGGFSRFHRMIANLDRRDLRGAADEMENSRWARQVGARRLGDDVRRMSTDGDSPRAEETNAQECGCNGSTAQSATPSSPGDEASA